MLQNLPGAGGRRADEMHVGTAAFDEIDLKRTTTELASNRSPGQTMLRLDERQRAVIADKLPDMANLVAAAIVIGFSIGQPGTTIQLAVAALAMWSAALLLAIIISRRTS